MGLFDSIFGTRKKDLTLPEIKRSEMKLQIRENQTISKLERIEKEREDLFAKGAKIKSPTRRRQIARQYEQKSQGIKMMEHDLTLLSKELTTIKALKLAMERREMAKQGIGHILNQVDEAELVQMLEDDKITEEVYVQKLDMLLGVVNDPAYESSDIGNEGMEVLKTWEKMDEGDLEFDDALSEATGKEKQGGVKEAKESEKEEDKAEPN